MGFEQVAALLSELMRVRTAPSVPQIRAMEPGLVRAYVEGQLFLVASYDSIAWLKEALRRSIESLAS